MSAPILHTGAGENVAGGRADGVLYFGTAFRVPHAVWKSGAYRAWILETHPPQSPDKIPGMEPVPGGAVELVEVYVPDASGDLWAMWRAPHRQRIGGAQ